MMGGWKTWVGVGLLVVAGVMQGLEAAGVVPAGVGDATAAAVAALGGAFGLVGVGHKVEKAAKKLEVKQ